MTAPNRPTISADLVVIGFGKAGKTLAATLGRQGMRVVLIERDASMYGGTCINIGCVPTKSMVYQAEEATARPLEPGIYTAAVRTTAELTAGHARRELRHARPHPDRRSAHWRRPDSSTRTPCWCRPLRAPSP